MLTDFAYISCLFPLFSLPLSIADNSFSYIAHILCNFFIYIAHICVPLPEHVLLGTRIVSHLQIDPSIDSGAMQHVYIEGLRET